MHRKFHSYLSPANLQYLGIALILISYAFFLSGCSTGVPTSTKSTYNPTQKQEQITRETTSPSKSNSSVLLQIETTPTVSPKSQKDYHYQTPTEQNAQLAISPITSKICSPLQDHAIKDLPDIVSAPYAPPPPGKEQRHHGVDFSYYHHGNRDSILGVVVQSIFNGKVAAAISDSFPYGNFVIVETDYKDIPSALKEQFDINESQSLYLLYAHLKDRPLVTLGDTVTACQPIGAVGKSGNAGIPHLHLEARIGPSSTVFNSMAFYQTTTTEEERNNYERWRTGGEFNHFDPMLLFCLNN